jgi:hypothetical protein
LFMMTVGRLRAVMGIAIRAAAMPGQRRLVYWYEEDEQVFVHPRNPYVRVDALRSHRHVRASLEGTTLAESARPVLVFETGLPTRYYFDRTGGKTGSAPTLSSAGWHSSWTGSPRTPAAARGQNFAASSTRSTSAPSPALPAPSGSAPR